MDFIDDNLYKYCYEKEIGDFAAHPRYKGTVFYFNEVEMQNERLKGNVFEGSKGGLIKGSTNNLEGGIFTILPAENGTYIYNSIIVPGDFILSFKAYKDNKEEINKLENNSLLDNILNYNLKEFRTPENCKIIDTGNNEISFILLSEYTQIVLSKITTANHINRLVEIESKYY